ncbi:MAG: methyltransferase domain-containing protein [Gammaproteobacteria bacterium]|nr:methyltransferase domain-containing protein [Gammaproteobacteria bacterium]NIN38449.1 methyltransferase domain-containing protein [Gammaproteobacteria bacterium]NIO64410.1 methyltransferase domain-containing protein [Gammaproteobacteria bacterium]NIT16179.1 methyltransferase domain-containing protein [Gammaproteobacteria bacterium]NIV46007.1 methyltransferase domain-containing protein [Gammaproteobacteria bacterium]
MRRINGEITLKTEGYIIRGGVEGRERLRLLSEVMGPSTRALLAEAGIPAGSKCLDVGCGGGDVTCELARVAGSTGRAIGIDRDETLIDIARRESNQQRHGNTSFEVRDVVEWEPTEQFDIVYARFLLSHLQNPERLIAVMHRHIRPGGMMIIEDIDFRGHFSEPDCPALQRYVELYTRSVQSRGADPNIGPRLPCLFQDAGFNDIHLMLVHPAALRGGIKLLTCLTLESIAETVLKDGLTGEEELCKTIEELDSFARNPRTVLAGPRIFQVWGRRS